MTKIQCLEETIPKEDTRRTVSEMRKIWTLSQELPEKGETQTIQRKSDELATHEENRPLAKQT